jgi:hypothetical protein
MRHLYSTIINTEYKYSHIKTPLITNSLIKKLTLLYYGWFLKME